jgi:hypothetical protein
MQGIIVRVDEKEGIERHLAAIWRRTQSFQIDDHLELGEHTSFFHYILTAKSPANEPIEYIARLFAGKLFDPLPPGQTIERLHLCGETGCFLPVAAHRAKDRLGDVWIMDQYGNNPHRIHDQCWHHVAPVYHTMVNTAEVFDPEPEYKGECWTKIVSWKGRVSWYAQMVSVVDEGGYEVPDYQRYAYYASPY